MVTYPPHTRRRIILLLIFCALGPAYLAAAPAPADRSVITPPASPFKHLRRHFDLNDPRLASLRTGAQKVQGVNSPDREDKPLITADGTMMFFNSSRRGDRQWASFKRRLNRYDDDIYVSTRFPYRTDQEIWSDPVNLGSPINSSNDEEIAAISPDGQSAYFTSLKDGWEKDGGPYYRSFLKGATWTEPAGLGGGIARFFVDRQDHSANFRVYGASISPDGNAFYFATTLHSFSGEQEIWVSHLRNGEWGYPENLGPIINSAGGSCAPFIAADGKTLFFASNRPGGYGGDDIYVTVLVQGSWQEAVNVGLPINTRGHDAFLSVPAVGDRVYLSSSREGNDDVYVAPLPEILRPGQVVLLSGIVTDQPTGKPLEANIVIEDLQTGVTVYNANSNAQSGRYTIVLQPGRDYGISMSAPGYGFSSERYTISSNTNYREVVLDRNLGEIRSGAIFTLNNVFYDYNSDKLRPESGPELDRVVQMMKDYPNISITVCGHTDSIGTDRYNQNLSERRAKSVTEYVTQQGAISPSRVRAKGFGRTQPAASNDTESGRQQNRRITFIIDGM